MKKLKYFMCIFLLIVVFVSSCSVNNSMYFLQLSKEIDDLSTIPKQFENYDSVCDYFSGLIQENGSKYNITEIYETDIYNVSGKPQVLS